ncbi:MAG: hypothetical protein AAB837_02870 [Patescibacteria group bacterium]
MISIYAKPPFLRVNEATGDSYVCRVSSRIRGEEISEYMGTKYNAEERAVDDLCIFIKPRSLNSIEDGDYVDVLDGIELIPMLKERPGVKVIAMSQVHYEYLKNELKNEIYLIHHHHINFERFRRTKNDILAGGMIGHSPEAYNTYNQIKESLAPVGIEFLGAFNYKTRQDMIDFFKKIDFFVAWWGDYDRTGFYNHPTKIINPASFGIPALTQPFIGGYKEFDGFYIPIEDMNSLVEEAVKLKDDSYYQIWSDKVFQEAEKYHISQIAELYKQLK